MQEGKKLYDNRTKKKAGGMLGRALDSLQNDLGKKPPQAVELEEGVLGAIMLDKQAYEMVADILAPESFYRDAHKRIFESMSALAAKSEPIDILTVTNQLQKEGNLEFCGGHFYVMDLTNRVSSSANIEAHARKLQEHALKRELISISTEINKDAFEDTTDVFELLDKAEHLIFKVSESSIRKDYTDMATLAAKAFEELKKRAAQKDGFAGVQSGFTRLDRLTSGWQKSTLVIIAARPGMGKTAFILSAVRNASLQFKKPVAVFSLEMSSVELTNRMFCAEAELDSQKIKNGRLEEHEWQKLYHRAGPLAEAPIFIDDTPAISIMELRTKCRRLKSQHVYSDDCDRLSATDDGQQRQRQKF